MIQHDVTVTESTGQHPIGKAEIYPHDGTHKIDITLADHMDQQIYDMVEQGFEIEYVSLHFKAVREEVPHGLNRV